MRLIDAEAISFEANEFETYNDYLTAFDAIDYAPTVDLWHYPSKGELPDKEGEYLVYIAHNGREYKGIGQYQGEGEWYVFFDEEVFGFWTPTAWMPLPDLPKEEA